MLPKKLLIDRVDCSKVIHVLQKNLSDSVNTPRQDQPVTAKHGLAYRCLDDFSDLAPTSLNNALQILERLSSLRFDSTIDKCTSLGIEAEASRDEDKRWADDGLAIWPNGLGCICDTILSRHQNRDSTRHGRASAYLLSVETFMSEGCVVILDMSRIESKGLSWGEQYL